MLDRVPNPGDWESFSGGHLKEKDLAYLTAKTGHEFVILQGKNEDILLHGESRRCVFDDTLEEMLQSGKANIYCHSHPGEETPTPSSQDRAALKKIGQSSSLLISGLTGQIITYTSDIFDDLIL